MDEYYFGSKEPCHGSEGVPAIQTAEDAPEAGPPASERPNQEREVAPIAVVGTPSNTKAATPRTVFTSQKVGRRAEDQDQRLIHAITEGDCHTGDSDDSSRRTPSATR